MTRNCSARGWMRRKWKRHFIKKFHFSSQGLSFCPQLPSSRLKFFLPAPGAGATCTKNLLCWRRKSNKATVEKQLSKDPNIGLHSRLSCFICDIPGGYKTTQGSPACRGSRREGSNGTLSTKVLQASRADFFCLRESPPEMLPTIEWTGDYCLQPGFRENELNTSTRQQQPDLCAAFVPYNQHPKPSFKCLHVNFLSDMAWIIAAWKGLDDLGLLRGETSKEAWLLVRKVHKRDLGLVILISQAWLHLNLLHCQGTIFRPPAFLIWRRCLVAHESSKVARNVSVHKRFKFASCTIDGEKALQAEDMLHF